MECNRPEFIKLYENTTEAKKAIYVKTEHILIMIYVNLGILI